MDPYAGFEPEVGEIRALRSFRIGPGGGLHPLFSDPPWRDGANIASCRRQDGGPMVRVLGTGAAPVHRAPDPDCTCGFYAYGTADAVDDYPHGRHVLAVIACWGRIIAGTRGLRAEQSRIEALWLSDAVPESLADLVRARYPSVVVYRDRARMLAEHPLTELDCYERPAVRSRWREGGFAAAAVAAVGTGAVPAGWLGGPHPAAVIWGSLAVVFLVLAVIRGRRIGDVVGRRQRLISLSVVLWMLAPFAGVPGLVLLRLPLVELGALLLVQRRRMIRAAGQFPATIG